MTLPVQKFDFDSHALRFQINIGYWGKEVNLVK